MLPVFIVTLHHSVTNKRIMGLSPYKRFHPAVVPSTVYTLFDILSTEEKGPKCSSSRCLFPSTSVQPFINQRTLGSMESERGSRFVRLADVYDTFRSRKRRIWTDRPILDNQQIQKSNDWWRCWSSLAEHSGRVGPGTSICIHSIICVNEFHLCRFGIVLLVCACKQVW